MSDSILAVITPNRGIWFRKITADHPVGSVWNSIGGRVDQIDAADGKVVVRTDSTVLYRGGITTQKWEGTNWQVFGAEPMIYVAVGDGKIMGIEEDFDVVARAGITALNPHGSSWTPIGGQLKQISIGDGKIVGINEIGEVYYRSGIDDNNPHGTGWELLSGARLMQIDVGDGRIVGVDATRRVWYRWGITASQPFGRGWKVTVGNFTHVSIGNGIIAGVDGGKEPLFCDSKTFPKY